MSLKAFSDALLVGLNHMADEAMQTLTCEPVAGDMAKEAHAMGEAAGLRMAADLVKMLKESMHAEGDRHPMSKDYLQEASKAIAERLPDNHGFVLLVSGYGDGQNRLYYTSTVNREDAINLLKEFLIKASGPEEWLKHIK